MTYLEKVKKLHKGKLPKSFFITKKYCGKNPKMEDVAETYFTLLIQGPDERKKAKKLGLL